MAHMSSFALSKLRPLQEDLSQVSPPGSLPLVGFPCPLLTVAGVGDVRKFWGDRGTLGCALSWVAMCSDEKAGAAGPLSASPATPSPAEVCRRDATGQISKDACRFG